MLHNHLLGQKIWEKIVENLDFYKILSYGAIGLGCILAFLSYRLLSREQDTKQPRQRILTSIYVFMVFSLALSTVGFVTEYAKDRKLSEIKNLLGSERTKNMEVANSLSEVLKIKEVAALESNASPEIQRHIKLLKNAVSRLMSSTD
jgi:hypothetical protein